MNDGRKKKPQKHQNKTAFKIQFDTLALDIQKKVSLSLLCKRCVEQMNWKLQFNKYKKITQPGKCNFCHQKNVTRSYMKSCDTCAEKENACPKCLGKDLQLPEGDQIKLSQKQQIQKDKQQEKALNDYVDSLKERSRRKVRRQYDKGIITWDNQNKLFRDLEGNELVGLKFKTKGLHDLQKQLGSDYDEDDENFDDNSQGDEDEEQQSSNKIKKEKAQKKKAENQQNDKAKAPSGQKQEDKVQNNEEGSAGQEHEEGEQGDEDQEEEWQQQIDEEEQDKK